jgi:hypothetical protein
MSVLVYGISERGERPVGGPGLQQRPLRGVYADPLAAIVSDHDDAPPRTVETLWEYEQIVERIAHLHTMIPARFGGLLDDDEAVIDMLRTRREELLAALGHTRGAVELALRASWQQAPEPHSQTGTGYMRARLELRRQAREIAGELVPLDALARASRCELPARPQQPLRCAYLVDREAVRDFTASIAQLDQQLSGVELVCTGPWPPYSFADGVAE